MDDHEKAWATAGGSTEGHARRGPGPRPTETLITDPKTGGIKGVKLARFDLLPWTILRELAEHFGRGARKYADRNWERGYAWSLSYGALHRHLESFWARDEIDHDPNLYVEGEPHTARHIIAVVWHACVLAFFSRYGVGTDDRPQLPEAERQVPNTGTWLNSTQIERLCRYTEDNQSSGRAADTIRAFFYGPKGGAPHAR